MRDETLEKLEHRIDVLEDLVQGDTERNIDGLIKNVSGLRRDFNEFKDVWNARANMFRGILWAVGGNGLLGILLLIVQLLGIGG